MILGQTPNKRLTNKRTIDKCETYRKRPWCSPRGRDSLINLIVGYFTWSKEDIRAAIKKAEKQEILVKERNSQFHLIYKNGKFWRKSRSRYLIQAKGAFFAGK
jgi:hypothetical protein